MAAEDQTPDVLTSLPRTRPQRRSAKRDAPKKATAAAKPAAAAKRPAPKRAAAKPKATKPKAAPKAKAQAAAKIPPAGYATPPKDEGGTPSGVELVGTAIQAAGELAQIGAAIGKQALKSALRIGR